MKIPRNSHCWCGSGKKYKNCHFLTDMREFAYEQDTPQRRDYTHRKARYFNKKYEGLTNVENSKGHS